MPGFATVALIACLLAFAISRWLTHRTLRYALRRQLLDLPDDRRSHTRPTPRGGGLGIVLTVLAALALAAAFAPVLRSELAALALALAGVAGIGWLDDHRPLPIWPRLAIHLLASTLVVAALLPLPETTAAWGLSVGAILAITVLINLWNFMDGIDGLAASQAMLVGAGAAIALALAGEWVWAILALSMVAATAGFLPFNLPTARIFLGDVGSGALGLLVGALLLAAVAADAIDPVAAPVAVSAFLIDGGLTLVTRMLRGDRWWRPHREHLYQWAVRAGLRHTRVTVAFAYWTTAAIGLSIVASSLGRGYSLAIAATLAVIGATVWVAGRRRLQRIAREGQGQ